MTTRPTGKGKEERLLNKDICVRLDYEIRIES